MNNTSDLLKKLQESKNNSSPNNQVLSDLTAAFLAKTTSDMEKIKGDKGEPGYSPVKGKDYFTESEINLIAEHIQSKVRDGNDGLMGPQGAPGKNGFIPIRGTDYWTEKDQARILSDVLEKIPRPKDGVSPDVDSIISRVTAEVKKTPVNFKDIKGTEQLIEFLKLGGFRGGGGSGGGGSSITLQTNGVANGSQSLLNLKQGTNVTITDDGVGGITINSTGGGTPGGLNTQLQYNNAGSFGGITGATTNGTIVSLTNPVIGGATITTSTVNGVTLTTGGGTTTFLNANGAYSTPTGTVVSVASADGSITVTNPTSTVDLAVVKSPILTTGRTIGIITGDATSAGSSFNGSANNTNALTLATVNSNVGTFTNATITVNGKGLITAASSGAAPLTTLTVGSTTITSGATTRILYDNAGVLGEYTLTGTGTVVAMQTAPTFITSITDPLVIGGTGTTSPLTLRSTSGTGAAGSDIIFQTGTNGGTEAMRILNSGNVGIGTASPTSPLTVSSAANLPIVVTGTLSPAVGGTFVYGGTYNSSPYWTLGSYFIWFRSGFDQWIMSTALGTVSGNFWFVGSANQLVPSGTGWAASGGTGTPILTVGTTANVVSSGIGNVIFNTNGNFGIGTNTPNYPFHLNQATDKATFSSIAAFSVTSASSGFMDVFRFAAGANGSRGGAMYFGEIGGGTTFTTTAEQILASLNSFGFVQEGNFPIYFNTNNTQQVTISGAGNVGIGSANTSPTARLHLPAGTATASTAPAKFTSGTNLTTAETGAMEYDGTSLFFTPTSTIRKNIPTIVMGRSTAQTAAVASVVTQTVGAADASFLVSANVNVTTATVHNFTVTCAYTDETNTARTLTLTFSNVGGTLVTTIVNTGGTVPYEGVPLHIRAKAATTITIATTGTFTTVTYNVEGAITLMK